jgi:sec-independent protein translocase protein TatA
VASEVDLGHGGRSHGPYGRLAGDGDDGPVVMGVPMHVEDGVTAGGDQARHYRLITPLADVHCADKHRYPRLMPDLGVPELLIILLVVLLFFGGAKLPKLARSLGEAQREFRKGHDEDPKDDPKAEDPKAT